MTSLVAILNDQAVALAADSAVTTSGPYGQKIYNTVNKLFTLSKYHPVGIMVYSSAEVMTVPIETVIKSYRSQRKDNCCLTLKDYYDDFTNYLKVETDLFPQEARLEHGKQVIYSNLLRLRDRIMRKLNTDFPDWGEPTRVQVKQVARTMLQEHHAAFHASNELPGVTNTLRRSLKTQVKDQIDFWKDEYKKTFGLSDTDIALISEISLDLLLREMPTGTETGFVIAGFGKNEYVPHLHSCELESSLCGVHKLRDQHSIDVSVDGASIVPFAQTEMVETFVRGRENRLDEVLLNLVDNYFRTQKQQIASNPATQANVTVLQAFLDQMNTGLKQHLADELLGYTSYHHLRPVLETVHAMPKEELAVMAEALVNLTSIKRRMSPDAETVGGPTDVAIISKGDGFIWIKRKHYFRPEFNPTFGHNYFNGG